MTEVVARRVVEERFLDAAERLLITVGYADISTRRLAEEAGANHGLVHYYFGTMEQLFVRVLERFTERLLARQRAMYAADVPFLEKWREAMRFLDQDFESGYQKVWLELQAMAWNRPDLKARLAVIHGRWRQVLREAFATALAEYDLPPKQFPLEGVVALVMAFNEGIFLERLSGITEGQTELISMIDRWLVRLDEAAGRKGRGDDESAQS